VFDASIHFHSCLLFTGKAWSLPEWSLKGLNSLAFPQKYRLVWERVKVSNTPAYYDTATVTPVKCCLVYAPRVNAIKLFWKLRAQCHKTFYGRNLRIFVISSSVCPWQAFSSLVHCLCVRPELTLEWSIRNVLHLGRLLALPTNIGPGWKDLLETTLAYCENS
jgi:hypothetical protein